MRWRIHAVVVVILGTAVVSPAQPQPGIIDSYVGQKLILKHFGGQREVEVRKEDFEKYKRGCDLAVEVKRATFKHRSLRFEFEKIGTLMVRHQVIHCTDNSQETRLSISHFTGTESTEQLTSLVEEFLQTPEAYLASHGIVPTPQGPADNAGVIELPYEGVTNPEALLLVLADYPPLLRLLHVQGVVKLVVEIGTDGVIHDNRVMSSPDRRLSEAVVRVLPLIRYVPARQGEKRVRVHFGYDMSFALNLN